MAHELYTLLEFLDERRLHYSLRRFRPETVCVTITIPGERIEIEVFDDEHLEITRFTGSEAVESGPDAVDALYKQLKDEAC